MIKIFIIKLLIMSIYSSVIGFLILAVKKIFNKVPNILCSTFWLIFLILLVVPINISSKISIRNMFTIPSNESHYEIREEKNQIQVEKNVKSEIETTESIPLKQNDENNYNSYEKKPTIKVDVWNILFALWIIVAFGLIIRNVVVLLLAENKIKKEHLIYREENFENIFSSFDKCKQNLNIKRNIKLILQKEIQSPALIGVLRPKIIATPQLGLLNQNEIDYIFTHELMHYKKKDHIIYVFLNTIKCIYWFNPAVNFLISKIKEDIEFITDRLVVNELSDEKAYLKILLKFTQLKNFNLGITLGIGSDKKGLERRIKMLKKKEIFSLKSISIFAILAVIIITAGISLATNATTENKKNQEKDNASIKLANIAGEGQATGEGLDGANREKKDMNNFVVIGHIEIPKTGIKYDILERTSVEALETSVAVVYPSNPQLNTSGNIVIQGYNYRDDRFFSNNKKLQIGDKINITDLNNETLTYTIYEIFETTPEDVACFTRDTGDNIEITLLTSTDDGKDRLVILARAKTEINNLIEKKEESKVESIKKEATKQVNETIENSDKIEEKIISKELISEEKTTTVSNNAIMIYNPLKNNSKISANYGNTHNGIDYDAEHGTEVYSVKSGKVILVGNTMSYGNYIVIKHDDGTESEYAHLDKVLVSEGASVNAKDKIGTVGETGFVTGATLHLSIKDVNGNYVDPLSCNIQNW